MRYKRLGDYIQLVDNRNTDGKITHLRGVSTTKQLIPSVANMTGVDITKYKVVRKEQFVYVADTSRRGDKIALAFNDKEDCIVSSIYTTFEVTDTTKLIPEFLFIYFNRAEFNRYSRFHSWGSARETFDWETMCNVQLPIPDIEEQKKYVDIYKGLLNNQKAYEKSLDDLQLICDTKIQDLIKNSELKPLGNYIESIDERNKDKNIELVKGVSINKILIHTKANMTGVNISSYKILRKGNFVFNPNTARMGEKFCIALNNGPDCLVSKIYPVFKIVSSSKLLPEYLLLYFSRSEFDRYVRFHSWGSARETFDWDEMCRVEIPVPDIEVQKAIVTIYHTLQTRKRINEQLKDMIKPLCPVLMKGVTDNADKEKREKESQWN